MPPKASTRYDLCPRCRRRIAVNVDGTMRTHGPIDRRCKAPLADEQQRRINELTAHVAMLTDVVVMAAALWFGQIPRGSEQDYASEVLHTTAADLVERNPRLAGAYKAAGQ